MTCDRWAEWLAVRRFGADEEVRREFLVELANVRERALDRARLEPGETLLDVGCGDGLIGFGALERGAGKVIFSDISEQLLHGCRQAAAELGLADLCDFVRAPADNLPLSDESVDIVSTRSVLIYVDDKERAFGEFRRVLRPGGRAVLWEPINRLYRHFKLVYDLAPVADLADRVWAVFERLQPPETDPMLNFDERDLVDLAERAGFRDVDLDLRVEAKPAEPRRWEAYSRVAGNPRIPNLEEAIEEALTPSEGERFVAHLRPLVEEGRGRTRSANALLHARK